VKNIVKAVSASAKLVGSLMSNYSSHKDNLSVRFKHLESLVSHRVKELPPPSI
jgi:hypothetical protein